MTFDEWESTHPPMQNESPNAYARRAFNAGVRSRHRIESVGDNQAECAPRYAVRLFKDALIDRFDQYPIPSQLGVTAIMKVIKQFHGGYTAPQAKCAPREKQNVMNIPLDAAVRFQSPMDGRWIAAPTPERADADTAGAISDDHAHTLYKLAHMTGFVGWLNEFRKSLAAPTPERAPREEQPVAHFIYDKEDDLWEQVCGEFASDADVVPLFRRSSPESAKQGDFAAFCEHYIDASEDVNREWLFNIVSKWIQWNAAPTPERADAEKDAALTGWAEEISDWITNSEFYIVDVSRGALVALHAAILAANKT